MNAMLYKVDKVPKVELSKNPLNLKKICISASLLTLNAAIFSSLFYLCMTAFNSDSFIFSKIYYKRVLYFTIAQAVISGTLCVVLSLFFLPSLFNPFFKRGEKYFWSILSLSYFTPFLIAALALIKIFGQNGYISHFCSNIGIPYQSFLYGMGGIIFTHIFFYLPLSIKILRRSLCFLPENNVKLSQMLGVSKFKFWTQVVFPFLSADILRVFSLITLFCLRSFTTVLIFGGGSPANNTLEIALYQTLQFEGNQNHFAQIALAQFLINSAFFSLNLFSQKISPKNYLPCFGTELAHYSTSFFWIFGLIAFFCIAIGGVFLDGLLPLSHFLSIVSDKVIMSCALKNLALGILVAVLTLGLCFLLFHGHLLAKLKNSYKRWPVLNFEVFGFYTLIFSPLVIATCLFYLVRSFAYENWTLYLCLALLQIGTFLPYVYQIFSSVYAKQRKKYDMLCKSMGIEGVKRFILIDFPHLKAMLGFCTATIVIFSLGDARSFLFFNIGNDSTLITLLFDKMNAYQFNEAAALASFILMLCLGIFLTTSRIFGVYKAK